MKTKILQAFVLFTIITIIAVLGIFLAYKVVQKHKISQSLQQRQAARNRQRAFREKFNNRMAQDRDKYTAEQLREAEDLIRVADQKWRSPEAIESCQTIIKKYPGTDRAGCALLYLAQTSQGDERIKHFQDCIEKYNDCFYGDGVQVGAFARFILARDYRSHGEKQKAEALLAEIRSEYADAIDHDGNLFVDRLKADSK